MKGDAARQRIEEDQFGLHEMTKVVAATLTGRIASNGYALGIEGEWGSGKTTLVNFICQEIQKANPHIHRLIRFEPWIIGSKDGLLRALFAALVNEIKDFADNSDLKPKLNASQFDFDRLTDRLQRYASHLDAASGIVAVGAPFDPSGYTSVGIALAHLSARLLSRSKRKLTNLETLRAEISSDLQTLDNLVPGLRFTVIIDDVDRLEPGESVELLRLVKSVANFPLLTYLLCFDRKTLSNHVQRVLRVSSGDSYLEKIFQITLHVPPQEPFALRRFLKQELSVHFPNEMGQSDVVDQDMSYRRHLLFDVWAGNLINTPRDVIRLRENVLLGWPYIQGDFLDYVWLQLIKLKSPELYQWIREYLGAIGAYRDGGRPGHDEPQKMAARLEHLMSKLGWGEYEHLSGLGRFVPGVENFPSGDEKKKVFDFSRQSLSNFEKDQRLGSPSHWRQYFAFDLPTYAVRDSEIVEFRKAAIRNDGSAEVTLQSYMAKAHDKQSHFVEVLLDRLLAMAISAEERKAIIETFVRTMDELGRLGKGELGRIEIWAKAAKFWNLENVELFLASFRTGQSINWLAEVLREQGFYHGRPTIEHAADGQSWLTLEQLDLAIPLAIKRFKLMGFPGVFRAPEPLTILYCWLQLGDAEQLKRDLVEAVKDNTIFLDAMEAMRSWSSGSNGISHPLHRGLVAHFLDADDAKQRLFVLSACDDVGLSERANRLLREWRDKRF